MSELQTFITNYLLAISYWMTQRQLKLNMSHTKPMIFLPINLFLSSLRQYHHLASCATQNSHNNSWHFPLPYHPSSCMDYTSFISIHFSPSLLLLPSVEVPITSLDYKISLLTSLSAFMVTALQSILCSFTSVNIPQHKFKIKTLYLKHLEWLSMA